MKTIISTVLFCCICLAQSPAQDSFLVMSVKGKVEYATGKSANWKKVSVGQILGRKDVIRTSYASYVKLMVNEQRLVSIDENSTKHLAELLGGKKSGNGEGAAGKILQYAAAQISRTKTKRAGPSYGAVRGEQPVLSAVFPMRAVLAAAPRFEWIDTDSAAKYEVLLLNEEFATVGKWTIEEAVFGMQIEPGLLAEGKLYHWQLTRLSDGEASNIQTFNILNADTAALVRRELESLDRELAAMKADDVTVYLIRAIYFEKRGLYEDAYRSYKETVRLAPEVEEYRDMMRNLLLTMRLLNEEELLMR